MSVKFEMDLRTKQLEDNLRLLVSGFGGFIKESMIEIGREMVSEARSRAGASFNSYTGRLLDAIKFIPTDHGGGFYNQGQS
jgi:hypothetical protein